MRKVHTDAANIADVGTTRPQVGLIVFERLPHRRRLGGFCTTGLIGPAQRTSRFLSLPETDAGDVVKIVGRTDRASPIPTLAVGYAGDPCTSRLVAAISQADPWSDPDEQRFFRHRQLQPRCAVFQC